MLYDRPFLYLLHGKMKTHHTSRISGQGHRFYQQLKDARMRVRYDLETAISNEETDSLNGVYFFSATPRGVLTDHCAESNWDSGWIEKRHGKRAVLGRFEFISTTTNKANGNRDYKVFVKLSTKSYKKGLFGHYRKKYKTDHYHYWDFETYFYNPNAGGNTEWAGNRKETKRHHSNWTVNIIELRIGI